VFAENRIVKAAFLDKDRCGEMNAAQWIYKKINSYKENKRKKDR